MKTINKKIIFGLSLLFLLCLSIGSICAEELNDNSLDISDNSDIGEISQAAICDENVDLTDSNEDLEKLKSIDDCQEVSTNGELLSSEDTSNSNQEKLESVSYDTLDSDIESNNVNQKNILSSSGDNYYNVYVDSVTARYGANKYVYFGWEGYFSGYFRIYDSDWECVHSEYIYGTDEDFQWSVDDLDVGTYTAALETSDDYWIGYGTIKITKSASKISVKTVKTKKGYFYFYAYVKDKYEGFNYNGGKVKFRIAGKNYYATLKNGVAKLKFKVPKKVKKYTCKATFLGGSNVYSSSKTFKVTVKKHKYYVYKAKTKFKTVKFGRSIHYVQEEAYAKKGWYLVKWWYSKKRGWSSEFGYYNIVYGKLKKTYYVKKPKYGYY